MRTCYKCKIEKNLDDFYKDKYDSLGRQTACKLCQKTRNTNYAENHREYFRLKSKEKYNPDENKSRYQKYQKSYLDRRNKDRLDEKIRLYESFKAAKSRAHSRKLDFSIDFEWIWQQYVVQNGKCLLTGIPFKMERNKYNKRFSFPFSVSIDRIDSNQGYTKPNTRLVCTIVNLALNRFGDEAFKIMCESYITHQSNPKQR